MASDRKTWDATTTLEALGAAEIALWLWEPGDETYAGLEARFAILFGSAMGV